MPISNPNPESRDIVIIQRDDANSYYGETHISGSNLIFYVDNSGHINADYSQSFYSLFPPVNSGGSGTTLFTGSIYYITSSWALSASQATSASWAPGMGSSLITGSLVPITSSQSISSSFAITASFAINSGGSGTTLITGSLVPITASWAQSASQAISASWAPGMGTSLITGSLVPITSSQSVSSSWSNTSASSSVVNVLVTASNVNFYVPFVVTNSYQPVYIDPNSIYYNPSTDILTINNVSASTVTASLSGTSSWANNSISSSYALTSSFVGNAILQGGNSFGTTASIGANDQNLLALRAAGNEAVFISSSVAGGISSGFMGIGLSTALFPLSVGGVGQIQLSGSSPRLVAANNSSSIKMTGGGPGIATGARLEMYGEGQDISSVGGGQLQGGMYFITKRSGSFIFQTSPTVGSAGSLSTLLLINPAGNSFNGIGSVGVLNTAPTASLDVTGDIRASTNITASNISASKQIQAVGITASLVGTASVSTTASFAQTASFLIGNVTSASYAQTSSFSVTSSFVQTASFLQGSIAYISSSIQNNNYTFWSAISGSPQAFTLSTSSNVVDSGSFAVLTGTCSWARNAVTASQGAAAWGFINYTGGTATSGSFYNASVTRGTTGSYNVLFNNALPSANYAVTATGWSGSNPATPTASYIMSIKQTTTGFTMSVVNLSAAIPPVSDFNTASFNVFSY